MFTEGGWRGPSFCEGATSASGRGEHRAEGVCSRLREAARRRGRPSLKGKRKRGSASVPERGLGRMKISAELHEQEKPPSSPTATGPGHLGHARGRGPDALRGGAAGPGRASSGAPRERKMAPHGPGSLTTLVPWAAALLLALGVERALALPEICTQCPGSVQNLSKVALYCKTTRELMLHARCCLNQKGTILGLDLQNCSLEDPGPNFHQALTTVIIDLQANPLKGDLANTFRGFTHLQTLILPQDVNCPGGINAWNTITSYIDNQICQGQKNLCNNTGDPEMCPENGSCVPDGPGLLQCVCADGFHGYKCMRQGSFSLLMFFGILGSTTLSVSILLWGTQRRKAKTS
nr:all-trans retinoic acid-induced differentiation factor isoform X1 [Symphalangus syndactylus]